MRKTIPPSLLSVGRMGLLGLLCLWTSCNSPRLAQNALPANSRAYLAEAPQAAQTRPEAVVEDVELVASSDPAMLPAVSENVAASISEIAAQNPKLARKVAKLTRKAEKQAATASGNMVQPATAKDGHAAQKLLAKAGKKFDIMKANKADAAQANTTLVALGALLAIVGLVLLLVTSGTAATIGLVSLAVGVLFLIISLLTN